jgi:hypothetical protein
VRLQVSSAHQGQQLVAQFITIICALLQFPLQALQPLQQALRGIWRAKLNLARLRSFQSHGAKKQGNVCPNR